MISDPIVYFTMDTADISGSTMTDQGSGRNNGTLTNSPTTGVTGKLGQAVTFASASSQWLVGTTPTMTTLTVAYWIKLPSTPNSLDTAIGTQYDGSGIKFFCDFRGTGNLNLTFGTYTGSNHFVLSNTALTTGTWYHIVGTFDGAAYKIYINGTLDNTLTDSTALYNGPLTLGIASAGSGLGRFLSATMDEVRVYNRALSSAEVTELYNFNGFNDPALYLTMDNADISSGIITDRGSGGNNGTLENSPTTGVSGKIGQAITFNGSTQYIDIGAPTALNLSSLNRFTLACWVYATTSQDGCSVISEMYIPTNHTVQYCLGFNMDGSNSALHLGTGFYDDSQSGWRSVYDSSTTATNAWVHCVGTWDGTYLRVYKNGTLVATSSSISDHLPTANFDKVVVAKRHDTAGTNPFFTGSLDEVRIYNRVLLDWEVTALYNYTISTGNTPMQGAMFAC